MAIAEDVFKTEIDPKFTGAFQPFFAFVQQNFCSAKETSLALILF